MPTYEYVCQACDHEFELFQQMTDPVKRKCPACGKLKLQRLIGTGAGVIFKGDGFYETDYRSESYKKAAQADKKAASESSRTASNATASNGDTKSASPRKTTTKPDKKSKAASSS